MAGEIVQTLFGVTPESYQQQQAALADQQALQYARLSPFQQANYANAHEIRQGINPNENVGKRRWVVESWIYVVRVGACGPDVADPVAKSCHVPGKTLVQEHRER